MLRALADYQRRNDRGLQGFLDEVSLDREREEVRALLRPDVEEIAEPRVRGEERRHAAALEERVRRDRRPVHDALGVAEEGRPTHSQGLCEETGAPHDAEAWRGLALAELALAREGAYRRCCQELVRRCCQPREAAAAALLGVHDFLGMLPELSARRAWLQAGRRRSDAEILQMFGGRWTAAVPSPRGDLHAEEVETSLMLAIAPHLVRMDLAAADYPPAPADYGQSELSMGHLMRSGVFGDPTRATAEKGRRWIELAAERSAALWTGFLKRHDLPTGE